MRTKVEDHEPVVTDIEGDGLDVVDEALRDASPRKAFTRDEARGLLRGVVAGMRDPAVATTAAAILDDAIASYDDAQLVARSRVVDPLLDLRLTLSLARSHRG